jgi:hypothetical protein
MMAKLDRLNRPAAEVKRVPVLNRALFAKRPLESGALSVLGAIFHRFEAAGVYEVMIRVDRGASQRVQVNVGSGATSQINLDVTALGGDSDCGCEDNEARSLNVGGVMGFYTSKGGSPFTVTVDQLTDRERKVVLDSAQGIPAGDLFSVTLIRPGNYRVTNGLNKSVMALSVNLPKGEKYIVSQTKSVDVVAEGFKSRGETLFPGQTLVFQCHVPAQLRVELVDEPQPSAPPAPPSDIKRGAVLSRKYSRLKRG